MSDDMYKAIARTDIGFLDIAIRCLTEIRLISNPLVNDLNLDIAEMVLRQLRERTEVRT